jgi:hypothetical protein
MKITREAFKNIVREVMTEESEYQDFFKRALEKTGKSIPDMSDEEKKAFFNKIDAAWDAKGEKNEELTGNQHKLDVDGDGEIKASDLAALRAGKTTVKEVENKYKKAILAKHPKEEKEIMLKIYRLAAKSNMGKITGDEFLDQFEPLQKQLKALRAGKTNEAMASGAWVGIEKTPKGPKLVKTFKSGNEAKAWVMKSSGGHSIMTKKDWDVSEGKSKTNEAGDERFDWPPVLDKFNTKEIQKLEADYKASLDKSSAILKKQWELINKGYPSDFPWENYDKWPAKLKAEVAKLTQELEKSRAKQPEMFKKLMQARGTWR